MLACLLLAVTASSGFDFTSLGIENMTGPVSGGGSTTNTTPSTNNSSPVVTPPAGTTIDLTTIDHKAHADNAAKLSDAQIRELFSKHTEMKKMRLKASGADTAKRDSDAEIEAAKQALVPVTTERDNLLQEKDSLEKKLRALANEYDLLSAQAKALDAEVIKLTPTPASTDLVTAQGALTAAQKTYDDYLSTFSTNAGKKADVDAIDWTTGDLFDALELVDEDAIKNALPSTKLTGPERLKIAKNKLALNTAQGDVDAKTTPPRAPLAIKPHAAITGAVAVA